MQVLKERKKEQEQLEDVKVMNYLKEKAVCTAELCKINTLP